MDWSDRIGRRIKLRDLHILLVVAERGSMAKASADLAISHPVISRTITDLERTLGVRLFDRHSQGVELTTYGRVLLECGTTVFDEMRQGMRRIESLTDPTSGELRIACSEITMAGLMPAITERLFRQHPGVHLHVSMANTAMRQFRELRDRQIDLMIGGMPQPFDEDDLVADVLFDEPFVVIAAAGSRWARRGGGNLGELLDAPWVLPPYDSAPGGSIRAIFAASKLAPPYPALTTLSAHLTVTSVASKQFVGILPKWVARFNSGRTGLVILPIRLPKFTFTTGIVTVKGRTPNPLAKVFTDCARDVGNALTGPMANIPAGASMPSGRRAT